MSAAAALFITGCQSAAPQAAFSAAADPYADDIYRISRIEVDPAQLEEYKAILKEEAGISYRDEPGVRTLFAMTEKDEPHKVWILEIYDSPESYKQHIASDWFQKYKQGTLPMVTELELIDCTPLDPKMLIKEHQPAAK